MSSRKKLENEFHDFIVVSEVAEKREGKGGRDFFMTCEYVTCRKRKKKMTKMGQGFIMSSRNKESSIDMI